MSMRWALALWFGFLGCVLGMVAADKLDSRFTGVCVLSGGAWFAIFGAVLGGAGDIARAIRETGHPPSAGGKSGRG